MFMMNRFLKNKKGVTILEGLIALGLLAMVAGGTFGVLLSVSRKASQPDIREEMVLAVERANEQLQMYTGKFSNGDSHTSGLCDCSYYPSDRCKNDNKPLDNGEHPIKCMLPAICDLGKSSFSYKVENGALGSYSTVSARQVSTPAAPKKISFTITCNGFTL